MDSSHITAQFAATDLEPRLGVDNTIVFGSRTVMARAHVTAGEAAAIRDAWVRAAHELARAEAARVAAVGFGVLAERAEIADAHGDHAA
jgi:hypothetical protein